MNSRDRQHVTREEFYAEKVAQFIDAGERIGVARAWAAALTDICGPFAPAPLITAADREEAKQDLIKLGLADMAAEIGTAAVAYEPQTFRQSDPEQEEYQRDYDEEREFGWSIRR